jgi:hypothetical protein
MKSFPKSVCTCFTSLLVLGRRGWAADEDTPTEKKEDVPAFLEPLSCLATLKLVTPNYLSVRAWRGRAAYGSVGRFIVRGVRGGNPSGK